jgi:hypothetical protein
MAQAARAELGSDTMPSTRKKSMTLQELERLVGYSVKQAVSEY